jgi:hypothetical protein
LIEVLWDVQLPQQFSASQAKTDGGRNTWFVLASPSFLAEQPIALPDLAGVSGFPQARLVRNQETRFSISAVTFDDVVELIRSHPTRERAGDRFGWSGPIPPNPQ